MKTHTPFLFSTDYLNQNLQLLDGIFPISDYLLKQFHTHTLGFTLQKDEYLLRHGEKCQYIYFIVKGAFIAYSNHKAKKIVTYISVENEFVSSLSGWFGNEPSREEIKALEESVLLAMPINIVQELFQTQLDLNFIFRTIIEKYYLDAQERSYTARLGNAVEKYNYFVESKPGFSERFALIDIASYLDMKPETLQRIQRKQKLKLSDTNLLCKKLEQYLHNSQVFTQKDLTLEKLAKELKFSIHKLSWLLNNVYDVNFHTYINNYRVEHIAQVLGKLNDWQDYTIEVVALQAGFGSRSSFYGHFKRHLHSSPKDYFEKYFSEIKKKREV